jgi:polyhydroxybutyrate depolymerase
VHRVTASALVGALVLLALPLAAASAGAVDRSAACVVRSGAETNTVDFDGSAREYRIATPSAEPRRGRAFPLILNFHGFTSNAGQQAVYSQLEQKGPAAGFVVVTPQGTGPTAFWNILPNLPKPDDVAYTEALIDTVSAQTCIDPARVYATGISNGAGMSTLLACELPNRIAAVAPVAGVNLVPSCTRGRPISVLAFHGEADAIVPYAGGKPAVGSPDIDTPPVEDAVAAFAKRDGCRARPVERTIGTEVTRVRYRGCDRGTDVELYSVANGGHTWPGSLDVPRLGHVTQDVNAADLILEFFDTHELRAAAS